MESRRFKRKLGNKRKDWQSQRSFEATLIHNSINEVRMDYCRLIGVTIFLSQKELSLMQTNPQSK